MDPILIGLTFLFGFGARQLGQPPLVGFLLAGFAANAMGIVGGETLHAIAEFGVILLLFTIGLEIEPKRLLRKEIWATATSHATLSTLLFAVGILAASAAGVAALSGMSWQGALSLGFALSFSSTVFAVKNLDDRGEHSTLHGRSAIGILILQDIFAVGFLTVAGGQLPEPWAIGLFALLALRPLLLRLFERLGHDDLVILFGLSAAVALGGGMFEFVGMKPGLGALLLGMLLAGHSRSHELVKALFPLKDLLLVGFFVQIGLAGFPSADLLLIAAILIALVSVKVILFFLMFAQLHFRARSSMLGALALGSYSEFGLIVVALAASTGWLEPHWPGVLAIAVAGSFIAVAPIQQMAHRLDPHRHRWLARFERRRRHADEQLIRLGDARIAVLGMGRVGSGAYDDLVRYYGDVVIGVEVAPDKIAESRAKGRNVIQADVTDPAFWHRLERGRISLVLLAMPQHDANIFAYELLKGSQFEGQVAAIARFPDEVAALEAAGVDVAFNMYAEAGSGFASHIRGNLENLVITTEKAAE